MYNNQFPTVITAFISPHLEKALRIFRPYISFSLQKIQEIYAKILASRDAIKQFWRRHFYSSFTFLKILDRYIIGEILRPFFAALLFFISLFITVALRESLGDLLAKNIDPWIMLLFFISAIVEQLPTLLPPVTLFAGLLAVKRLAADQELIAMRSSGMSYGHIYFSFAALGFFFCLCMALFSFYLAPLNAQYRRALSEGVYLYQSIAFVREGNFFNRFFGGGDHTDIYAEDRDGSTLSKVYVHRWQIDPHGGSIRTFYRDKYELVGSSQTQQIIFAKKGEIIKRSRASSHSEGIPDKEQREKGNKGRAQKIKETKLPKGLAGRDLMDLSFTGKLPKIEDETAPQKYIRLEKGFMIQLNPQRTRIQTSNFRQGLMEYSLDSPLASQGYFGIVSHTLTLNQLVSVYYKFNRGGLVIDPFTVYGNKEPSPENYIEIPPKKLLSLLKQDSLALSNLSPEEIYHKHGLYIPAKEDTPEKRQIHFKHLYSLGSHLLENEAEFLFLIHQRISLTLSVFLFLLIALPLGESVKRSGKTASFGVALLIYALYAISDKSLELAFQKGKLDPALAAWLPEIVLFLAALLSLLRSQESRYFLASLLYPQQK